MSQCANNPGAKPPRPPPISSKGKPSVLPCRFQIPNFHEQKHTMFCEGDKQVPTILMVPGRFVNRDHKPEHVPHDVLTSNSSEAPGGARVQLCP